MSDPPPSTAELDRLAHEGREGRDMRDEKSPPAEARAASGSLELGRGPRRDGALNAAIDDALPQGGEGADDETSPLSIRRLSTANPQPAPPSLSRKEREDLAQKRVGTSIKGWRLARLLGVGPVTAAYDTFRGPGDGGEHVVLKLMLGQVSKHERARGTFLRGAYASNRFNHPRVLAVTTDGSDAEGAPFVIRPWVDAEPLDAVVAKSDALLSEAQVLRMAEQVLDALEIAHAHGIVHGAITPRNVLVTPRGSIRLCDFATPPGMGPRTAEEEDVLAERRAGPFAPPERCAKPFVPASEQSDIYSLAACMYFAVSKAYPRGDAKKPEALAKTAAIPLRDVNLKVSEFFATIVDHALNLEPEGRYESAYAMLGDVRRVMAGRKPKLGDALRPVPSGSYSQIPALNTSNNGPPSSVRPGTGNVRSDYPPMGPLTGHGAARGRKQWKGNAALILAIALLVGVATFVMVREKVEESREQDRKAVPEGTPSASAPVTVPATRTTH